MKKSLLYTGIAYLVVGTICLLLAILCEFRIEGLLWGFAGAGTAPGILMIWKYFHWSKPERQKEYERLLQIEKIEMHDERKVMLWDKSGRIVYGIMIGVYCGLMALFAFFTVMGWWMPYSRYAVMGLGILLVFQYICGIAVFQHLAKRM
ncbi:MAG TPA: hypothetical protein DF480_06770 [Clostridiales bacterium]|jgi:hypothetical protein|nr:hypothetical protein [Clostridiales bacterium]